MNTSKGKQARGQVILGYARFIKKRWGAQGLEDDGDHAAQLGPKAILDVEDFGIFLI